MDTILFITVCVIIFIWTMSSIFIDAFVSTKRVIQLMDYIEANRENFIRVNNVIVWKIKDEHDVDKIFSYMLSVEDKYVFAVF